MTSLKHKTALVTGASRGIARTLVSKENRLARNHL